MSAPLAALRSRYDRIAIPTIWLAFALSLVLHALLLTGSLPKVRLLPFEDPEHDKPSNALAVRLVPLPGAAPAPPPSPALQPAPAHRPAPPRTAQQRPPAPPLAPKVLALQRPSPSGAAPPPASEDFAASVEARRRAREAAAAAPSSPASPPAPPAESEQERINRMAAANLGLNEAPSFGADRNRGGGIFQIRRMGLDSAEFVFFGWNRLIKRNAQQMIEVRRGDNTSIEIAVARRMIAIIREHESGDFVWQSRRLGRELWLSARVSDNAELEAFMLREFFPDLRPRN